MYNLPHRLLNGVLDMDMAYLLALQNFRNGAGAFLTPVMFAISNFTISFWIMAIVAIIYWCCDKRLGKIILMNMSFSFAFITIVKNSFCVYRPWMKNTAIIPAGNAIHTAGGYSFPSGHTVRFASIAQPIIASKRKTNKTLCALLILGMLAVAFSRNFLGVHTPQDVICGLLLSALSTFICIKIDKWLEEKPEQDTLFFLTASVFFLFLTAIFILKSYPVDYHADKIIFNPLKAKYESYCIAGNSLAFLIGWYAERKFINFEIPKQNRMRIIAGTLGIILFLPYYSYIPALKPLLFQPFYNFIRTAAPYIFILIIWPAAIKLFFNKTK